MSSPSSSKHGPYRKPRADIYTVLLIIALVALLIGCVFVYLETADYPDKPKWSGAKTAFWESGADTSHGGAAADRFSFLGTG